MFDFRNHFTRIVALVAIMAAVVLTHRAAADVVTTGVVSPIPPAAGGTFATQLIVGNGTNEESRLMRTEIIAPTRAYYMGDASGGTCALRHTCH